MIYSCGKNCGSFFPKLDIFPPDYIFFFLVSSHFQVGVFFVCMIHPVSYLHLLLPSASLRAT